MIPPVASVPAVPNPFETAPMSGAPATQPASPQGRLEDGAVVNETGERVQSPSEVLSPGAAKGAWGKSLQWLDRVVVGRGDGTSQLRDEMKGLRDSMRDSFGQQLLVQEWAMRVEIGAKVVEHGTSGVRTVLQTQA